MAERDGSGSQVALYCDRTLKNHLDQPTISPPFVSIVYVCRQHPNGLNMVEYRKVLKANPDATKWSWQTMVRDPVVYVRGKITHPDHATIRLNGWHRVEMNTENRATAMASVAFLD